MGFTNKQIMSVKVKSNLKTKPLKESDLPCLVTAGELIYLVMRSDHDYYHSVGKEGKLEQVYGLDKFEGFVKAKKGTTFTITQE